MTIFKPDRLGFVGLLILPLGKALFEISIEKSK